ncbi:hypothetical protein A3K42_00680 [candidate division WWE3 bacterium RBG_13_37_7]|uniref:Uncharacterized protein n=1 Tax=candidate division WWE3 bacterium RBG_13_37_7 TaxID=1802609 RepID=A0A1F4U2K3_UNCKA|nr:MAG: hypothetical protein A3K42_00680 [candidate division WWE3 bacterium RBG_13_37_7]
MQKLLLTFFILLLSLNLTPISWALDCSGGISDDMKSTSLATIVCPVARGLNVLIWASGVIFAIFIVYSAIKLSMAAGDPKGFDAAKNTLMYAIIGFGIVLGFFVIFQLASGIFGLSGTFSDPTGIFTKFQQGIFSFERMMGGTSN